MDFLKNKSSAALFNIIKVAITVSLNENRIQNTAL